MQIKKRRQDAILSLIQRKKIGTQVELVEQLSKLRFQVTQSSVSRDLEDLGIVKLHGFYAPPAASKVFAARGILSLEAAGDALVVAKCEAGVASAVTVEIDKLGLPEIVGTIAGDDTIFIAVRGRGAQKAVIDKIRGIFFPGTEAS